MWIVVVVLAVLSGVLGVKLDAEGRWERQAELCEATHLLVDNLSLGEVNGFYSPSEKYYVVWVKGRSFAAVNRTDYHEACHAIVADKPDHFCDLYSSG